MFKNRKSFTLVELLMVIAIIGILSAVVIVNLSSARTKAKDSRVKSDVLQAAPSVEAYFGGNYDKTDLNCTSLNNLDLFPTAIACDNSSFVNSLDIRKKTIGKLAADANSIGGNFSIYSYGTGYFISAYLPSSLTSAPKSFFVDSKANTGTWNTPGSAIKITSDISMAKAQADLYFDGTYSNALNCYFGCQSFIGQSPPQKNKIGLFADEIQTLLNYPGGGGTMVGMFIAGDSSGYKIYAPLSAGWGAGMFCIDSTGKYFQGPKPDGFSWFSVTCP